MIDDSLRQSGESPIYRSSPLGLYIRRADLAFKYLSFDEVVIWWEQCISWFDGLPAPSIPVQASQRVAAGIAYVVFSASRLCIAMC